MTIVKGEAQENRKIVKENREIAKKGIGSISFALKQQGISVNVQKQHSRSDLRRAFHPVYDHRIGCSVEGLSASADRSDFVASLIGLAVCLVGKQQFPTLCLAGQLNMLGEVMHRVIDIRGSIVLSVSNNEIGSFCLLRIGERPCAVPDSWKVPNPKPT